MRIVSYSREYFGALSRAIAGVDGRSALLHAPFVDYYYGSSSWCRLYLALNHNDEVVGTIGLERLRFRAGSVESDFGFATAYYALQPGVGGVLYLQWMKLFPAGLVFGGSQDTHEIIGSQHWKYYAGINVYALNRRYPPYEGEWWFRRAAKWGADHLARKTIGRYGRRLPSVAGPVAVEEVAEFSEDLLPRNSPFSFRFAPEIDYLRWRYNPSLSFVRYRIFRVATDGAAIGVVVLKDDPEEMIVSFCDGEDAGALACGVLKAVLAVAREDTRPRTVVLSSSHPVMQGSFSSFGFRPTRRSRPFAVGTRGGAQPAVPPDPSGWLINFDIGDNGLRTPFLNQTNELRTKAPCFRDSVRINSIKS
jgi:hypothetical protein